MKPVVKRPVTIRLVLLYIIDAYKSDIPESVLSDIMVGDIEVNFFDYKEAYANLEDLKYIRTYKENGKTMTGLTPEGKDITLNTCKKLAYQLRLNIADYIQREKLKIIKGKEFLCEIVPISDVRYSVKVSYTEADEELITISFNAGDKTRAGLMAKSIKESKNTLYLELSKAIANALTTKDKE